MSKRAESIPSGETYYTKRKVTLFVIILIMLVPGLIVLGEGLARVAMNLAYGVKGKSYGIYTDDPVLGHMPAPDTYNHLTSLNDRAFRNREDVIEPKPKGALRLIAYGGSTTFAYNLPTEKTWTYLLQRRMRDELGSNAHQVLNAGVVLWSISHAFERAKREIPVLKPDYVLLYSGINEESNAIFLEAAGPGIRKLVVESKFGVAADNYIASSWLHRNSLVFKLFRNAFISVTQGVVRGTRSTLFLGDNPNVYVLTNYLKVLDSFVGLTRANGAKLVFMVQVSRDTTPADKRAVAYSARGSERLRPLGVKVIDTRDMVRRYTGKPEDLFETSIHYSERGARVLTDYLFRHLFKVPMADEPSPPSPATRQ